MNLSDKIILYSADEKITLGKLKKGESLFGEQKNLDIEMQKIRHRMGKNDVKGIIETEQNYHYKLKGFKQNPHILYYKGNSNLLNRPILGIVGPRNLSDYALKVLNTLFEKLVDYDVVTISGMAEGVDTVCHNLSIEKNIPTIAVLGGGIRYYLESKERGFIQKIVDNGGLVVSEFKLGMKPEYYTFPQRNRIIAGLCDVLFLPEAGVKSGSLITADFALQMNKPIYATSGGIFSSSSFGINQWIADKKINLIYDIGVFLDKFFEKKEKNVGNDKNDDKNQHKIFSEKEQKILTLLSSGSEISLQDILSQTGLKMSEVMMILTMLEMEGCVVQSGPGRYKKC